MKKSKIELVKAAALFLMNLGGRTTTLDVKNLLRENDLNTKWRQKDCSNAMQIIEAEDDMITYDDNGFFREYYLKSEDDCDIDTSNFFERKETLTNIVELLSLCDSDDLVEITWNKKNGDIRIYDGFVNTGEEFSNLLGHITFKTIADGYKKVISANITRIVLYDEEIILNKK